MSQPYHAFVAGFADLLAKGRQLPLGDVAPAVCLPLPETAPWALVFSPHPDDESIIGALPLRLRREAGFRVAVVAVTQGSKAERQAERLEEMRGACGYLGFDLLTTGEHGLSGINPTVRRAEPLAWKESVHVAARIIKEHKPRVIVVPHELDGHSTHQGTNLLVMDALRELGPDFACHVVLAEYWAALVTPNLMVESTPAEVADLMTAISFHKGEVARNPYHVLLPSWMSDNVRRGSELVGGLGGVGVDFTFATLYRIAWWNGQELVAPTHGSGSLAAGGDLAALIG